MTDPAIHDFMEDQAEKRKKELPPKGPRWWIWIKENILKPMGDGFQFENTGKFTRKGK
jgi:hypothetical protein